MSCDATVINERLLGLALAHIHKDKTLDAERIIHQFSQLALTFRPKEGEGSNCTHSVGMIHS